MTTLRYQAYEEFLANIKRINSFCKDAEAREKAIELVEKGFEALKAAEETPAEERAEKVEEYKSCLAAIWDFANELESPPANLSILPIMLRVDTRRLVRLEKEKFADLMERIEKDDNSIHPNK